MYNVRIIIIVQEKINNIIIIINSDNYNSIYIIAANKEVELYLM